MLACAAMTAHAATLAGRVVDQDGTPVRGAMVTLTREPGVSVTRYTRAGGEFAFPDAGSGGLRVRLAGYRDERIDLAGVADRSRIKVRMVPQQREELLESLPAHVWAERIRIEDPVHAQRFRIHCMACHQQGNAVTRWPTDHAQWNEVFDRMAHKSALLTPESRRAIAEALLAAYRLAPAETPRLPQAASGRALDAEITEWRVSTARSWLHDVKAAPDGRVYATDSATESLWRLDPRTHTVREWQLARYDPQHRNMVGAPSQTYPHGLAVDGGGAIWATLGLAHEIVKLDPSRETVIGRYRLPAGTAFPHTARFDADGRLWFSLALSNQLGVFDPASESFAIIDLPVRNWRQGLVARVARAVIWTITRFRFETTPDPELMPMPYGVDVAPDGTVWVSQWNNRSLVAYAPHERSLRSYDTPFYGPRRIAIDSKGMIWIPAWGEGRVYRFDPGIESFSAYDLPTGPGDASYAVAVHPHDDAVWICGANSDTLMRLDPTSGAFDVYPMPSRVTFCRDISFDAEGNVWTNYSNFPTAHIEGERPVLVRLAPDGARRRTP